MKTSKTLWHTGRLLAALAFFAFTLSLVRAAHVEEKYDVLQTKAGSYTNVTVTTHARSYIFITHSTGMRNIKVADLPLEVQQDLGYAPGGTRKVATAEPGGNTLIIEGPKKALPQSRLTMPKFKFDAAWAKKYEADFKKFSAMMTGTVLLVILGAALAAYLFFTYCAMLICKKAGSEPGVLVWIPGLQMIPLLRAAGMSGWWFIAYLIPLVSLIAHILWCVNIVKAREKSMLVVLLLLFPVTSLFGFLYLAFSGSNTDAAAKKDDDNGRAMVFQTA